MSVIKLDKYLNTFFKLKLQDADKELYDSIRDEFSRQQNHIELSLSMNQSWMLHQLETAK